MTRLRAFLADENGTATIEFVFFVPIVMMIFFASFESGYYMIRHVMLERSVDIVIRDIRLGTLDYLKLEPTAEAQHAALKDLICGTSILMDKSECIDDVRIWMQPINTANFDMVAPPRDCRDKAEKFDPLVDSQGETEFKFGDDNEIMLLRICIKEYPMFPTTAVGAGLIAFGEDDGAYALQTTSVFVNEPG
jgi:TadE-like protein